MSWEQLGTVAPTHAWQPLNALPGGSSLFRLRQQWEGSWPGTGYLQISFVYPDAGRLGFKRVGADKEPSVLDCPFPESLAAAGFTSRQIAIRLNLYARLYASAAWVVSVDQWIE